MEYRATATKMLSKVLKLTINLKRTHKYNKSQDGIKKTFNNIETVVLVRATESKGERQYSKKQDRVLDEE